MSRIVDQFGRPYGGESTELGALLRVAEEAYRSEPGISYSDLLSVFGSLLYGPDGREIPNSIEWNQASKYFEAPVYQEEKDGNL